MPLSVYEYIPEYTVEPELHRPAPRRLGITTWPTIIVLGCAALSLLLIGCAGLIALRSVELLWLARRGTPTIARVVDCDFTDGGRGECVADNSRTVARVDYVFGPHGSWHGSAPAGLVSEPPAVREPAGSINQPVDDLNEPVTLIVQQQPIPEVVPIRFAFWKGSIISSPVKGLSDRSLVLGFAVSLLVAAIAIGVCVRFARWLRRTVRLLRSGEVAIATILAKEIRESDLPRYYITYGFVDSEGAPFERNERCTPEQWRRLEIGQEATVLYPGAQPSRAELYAHLPLRCA